MGRHKDVGERHDALYTVGYHVSSYAPNLSDLWRCAVRHSIFVAKALGFVQTRCVVNQVPTRSATQDLGIFVALISSASLHHLFYLFLQPARVPRARG